MANLLETRFPELFAQLHPTKNIEHKIDVGRLTCGVNKRVWWLCPASCLHHEWMAIVNTRTKINGTGCPFCSKRCACPCTSFMNIPLLAAEFNVDANLGIDPDTIYPGSTKVVHWKCSNKEVACDCHRWTSIVRNRAIGGSGCPFCTGKRTCVHKSFMNIPLLAAEFDASLNLNVSPWALSHGSDVTIWWRCSARMSCDHHIWSSSI